MVSGSWAQILVALGALVVFAAAAAIEAVVGIDGRGRLRELADGPGGWRRTVEDLLAPRRALTASLLAVQVVALAVIASVLTSIFARGLGWGEHALAVATVVLLYTVFGMALPTALRRYRRDDAPAAISGLARGFEVSALPIVVAGARLATWLGRLLPPTTEPRSASAGFEEELTPLLRVQASQGAIEAAERAMIQGVLDLEDLTVREIMVPRVDIVAVEVGMEAGDLVATIVRAGHSRIPVFRESIDQIVGVLYAKDLIPFVLGATTEVPLADLVRPPFVVPDSKRVDVLLREMRRSHIHLAIIADEYGGTAGLVTIEDILEEIVGEIQDEYDVETPRIERLADDVCVLDARLPLGEVEEELAIRFPEDADYETLGGYVQTELGRLPRAGDRFTDPEVGVAVEILEVEGRRIGRVRVERLSSPEGESEELRSERQPAPRGGDGDVSSHGAGQGSGMDDRPASSSRPADDE